MISVLIPCYNADKYIERCINSILKQSYQKFHIILWNDGSSDNTLEILNKYKKFDKRIIVYSSSNEGLSNTRNKLISKVKDPYFYFIDADDWLETNTLEKMIKLAINNDSNIVLAKSYINKSKKQKPYFLLKNMKYKNLTYYLEQNSPYAWNTLISKKFYDDTKLSFNVKHRYFEDAGIMINLLLKAENKISFLDEFTYHYFYDNNSLSRSNLNSNKIKDAIAQLDQLLSNININKIKDESLKQAIIHQISFYFSIVFYQCKFSKEIKSLDKKQLIRKLLTLLSKHNINLKTPKNIVKKWSYLGFKLINLFNF